MPNNYYIIVDIFVNIMYQPKNLYNYNPIIKVFFALQILRDLDFEYYEKRFSLVVKS